MSSRIEQVFGAFMRPVGAEGPATADGRNLDPIGLGMVIAVRLIETDPARYADEIIKIMKPFCRPFDIEMVRNRIIGLAGPVRTAKEQAAKEKAAGPQLRNAGQMSA